MGHSITDLHFFITINFERHKIQEKIFEFVLNKSREKIIMAAPTKFSTNLAKMLVSKQPHTELARIYSKNLRALAKMPTDYPYRKYTENVIMERAALVKNEPNIQELEKKINCG